MPIDPDDPRLGPPMGASMVGDLDLNTNMAITELDIANRALSFIGQPRVSSLSEDSKAAREVKFHYPFSRDSVLRAASWNSARRYAKLAPMLAKPAFNYEHQFLLPTDLRCLRVLRLQDYDGPWEVQGRVILADTLEAWVIYIAQVADVTIYDPLLVDTIAAHLALSVAVALTGNNTTAAGAEQTYKGFLQEARYVNAEEASGKSFIVDDFSLARHGSVGVEFGDWRF